MLLLLMGGRAQLLLLQLLLIQRLLLLQFVLRERLLVGRTVLRERLLVGRTVLLYLGHKVNNYTPIRKGKTQDPKQAETGNSSSCSLSLSHALSLSPENSHLEQDNSMRAQLRSRV
jgi:hypothetical protein